MSVLKINAVKVDGKRIVLDVRQVFATDEETFSIALQCEGENITIKFRQEANDHKDGSYIKRTTEGDHCLVITFGNIQKTRLITSEPASFYQDSNGNVYSLQCSAISSGNAIDGGNCRLYTIAFYVEEQKNAKD